MSTPVFRADKLDTKGRTKRSPTPCSFSQSLHIKPNSRTSSAITKYSSITSIWKGKAGRDERKACYQTASVVFRELVDRDLGFIIILILGEKKRRKVFWLIQFSCLSTNIFHFPGRLLEEIQGSRSPAPAQSPEHKEAAQTPESFPLSYRIHSSTWLFGSDSSFFCLHCQGRNWSLNLFFIGSQGIPTQ